MSRIADEYGLDVWIWYPAMDTTTRDPKTVEFALKEWGEVFQQLPRIDAVFVPGGDPGHTAAEAPDGAAREADGEPAQVPSEGADVGVAAGLHRSVDGRVLRHPEDRAGLADAASSSARRSAISLPESARGRAEAVPDPPLSRHHAQPAAPVSGAGLGRRATRSPRPRGDQPAAAWTRPTSSARCMPYADRLPHLLRRLQRRREQVRLERAGLGPEGRRARDPARVQPLLHRRRATPIASRRAPGAGAELARAAGAERRRRHDAGAVPGDGARRRAARPARTGASSRRSTAPTTTPTSAAACCTRRRSRSARSRGCAPRRRATSLQAIAEAARILDGPQEKPSPDWRLRVFELAEALFQSIRQQLSVDALPGDRRRPRRDPRHSRHAAEQRAAGSCARFAEAAALENEGERLAAIDRIVHWTDPGPGRLLRRPRQPGAAAAPGAAACRFDRDPQRFKSSLTGFGYRPDWRLSWMTHAEIVLGRAARRCATPGSIRAAHYRVRVVYAGDVFRHGHADPAGRQRHVRSPSADAEASRRSQPVEFDIPPEATEAAS